MERFRQLTLRAAEYQPTAPRSGNVGTSLLRLRNMLLAGVDEKLYLESYRGSLNLTEPIATLDLTGTITAGVGVLTIVGTSTLFKTQLRSGQFFFAGNDVFMVNEVIDDTHITVYRGPSVALVAATGKRSPVLFEIGRKRGTLIQGNAVEFDKGTILVTGRGTLRINGAELTTVSVGSSTRSVGTGADDTTVGTVVWTNPGDITASGGSAATCVPASGEVTHYIKGTNCGFTIPGGATILGIKVEVRKALTGATTEVATDQNARIVKADGTIGTTNRSAGSVWPAALTYSAYGSATDLWGLTWTPADINDADFGAVLSAAVSDPDTDAGTLQVDHMRISVYYTVPTALTMTGTPFIAIYNSTTNSYFVYPLGLATPTTVPTISSVAGSTHGMVDGNYSLRMVPSRTATNGYGNPGPRADFTIVTEGQRAEVDSSAVPMDTVHGQDQWDVYATEKNVNDRKQGPWWFVREVPDSEGPVFFIDYLDAEINRRGLLDFNNDPPPDAGFIATLEGNPQWVSCFGKFGGSPGPSLVPAKPFNIEAAPSDWNVTSSPPENLLGVVTALAKLYLPTPSTLQQGIYAPKNDPFQIIPPTSIRTYWNVGFSNPYQITFVANNLVGYPHNGPTKSIVDAEVANEQFIGGHVAEIIKEWIGAHVLVEHDPDPNVDAVCFFHPADSQNEAGWWRTRVLLWGVRQSAFIGEVMIESATRDMNVVGVAKVDRHLEFLAGGRNGAGGIDVQTFRWNQAAGSPVEYFAAPQLQDGGSENQNKAVRSMRVTGKLTSGVMQLHGYDSAVNINITDIENGTNSASGSIAIGTQTEVQKLARAPMNFPNLAIFTARVSGTYSGSGDADRIDEVVLELEITGNRR